MEKRNVGQKIGTEVSMSRSDLAELSDILARLVMAGAEADAHPKDVFTQDKAAPGLSTWLMARELLHHRRQRTRFFAASMFGEPAWEMLLTLFANTPGEDGMTVNKLIAAAGVPATSGKRWLDYLEQEQLLTRRDHASDQRMTVVTLTPKAKGLLTNYLESLAAMPSWHTQLDRQRAGNED